MPHSTSNNTQQWQTVFENAKKLHLGPHEVPWAELADKFPVSERVVADTVIQLQTNPELVNPLIPQYVESVIKSGYTDVSNVLLALLRHSRFLKSSAPIQTDRPQSSIPGFEQQIFTVIRNLSATSDPKSDTWHSHATVWAITRWLHVARKANDNDVGKQMDSGAMHAPAGPRSSTFEALGMLAIAVFSQPTFRNVEKQSWWKARKRLIALEMESYDSHVFQWIQTQFTGQLLALSKQRPFRETDAKGMPIFTSEEILSSITELPMVNSRAGLFVWLNACLCARPLTDDATMRNYVMVRYHDDAQEAASNLLIASFDVITNLILRGEPRHTIRAVRSFICNKLPLVLHALLGFTEPNLVEAQLRNAFQGINMEPLTPLTTGSNEARELLKRTRLDFLSACVLHSLITENSVAAITQETAVNIGKVTRYTKEGLLAQCANNTSRLEGVIQELDLMQGNASAIAACVVETLSNLCATKDTMTLKAVCNALLRKVSNLDAIMQNTQPSTLLLPLCNVLNGWVHDQDQSEFQPPYEEFACILLFVLAAVHRYNLSAAELGLMQPDSFIAQLLQSTPKSFTSTELTDDQRSQLSKWIEGLYATDELGDTTGIGDEVMSQCPPQAFYTLVPTLFEQSVLACKSGQMSVDTARGGLEFLLEPFLLPSLVGGITWIVKHAWEDHDDADILLQILDKLLKPSSSAQEMQVMHKAILAIVADPLEHSLRELVQRRPDKKKTAGSLVEILKVYSNQQRVLAAGKLELEGLISGGTSTTTFRNTIKELSQWAASGGNSALPNYAPRSLYFTLQAAGNDAVLQAILEEIKAHTEGGSGSFALDVCTAVACAPEPASYTPLLDMSAPLQSRARTGLTLRESIRLRTSDPQQIQDMQAGEAEALVRLSRLVEAQCTVSPTALVSLPAPVTDQAVTDQVMKDLGLADSTVPGDLSEALLDSNGAFDADGGDFDASAFDGASNQVMDLTSTSNQNMSGLMADSSMMQIDQPNNIFDLSSIDFGQPQQQGGGNVPGNSGNDNGEDDIFADLDLGQDFDFS